jgi:uncharacterized protein YcgI (DUF1989 family)
MCTGARHQATLVLRQSSLHTLSSRPGKQGKLMSTNHSNEPSTSAPPEDAAYARYLTLMKDKPVVPGAVSAYEFLPPRGYWGGLVEQGQVIRVIDLEGKQCFDSIIYDAGDLYNRANCSHSMGKERKWDNWVPGDGVWSKNGDRLAMISEDTTAGHHAFAGAFCNEAWGRMIRGVPNQHTCHDNFVAAMRMAGYPSFSAEAVDWGSCVSFFMHMIYKADGGIEIPTVSNKPGDYIDLKADRDLVVTISNCPSEAGHINNWDCTALYAVIFDPDPQYSAAIDAIEHARATQYGQ